MNKQLTEGSMSMDMLNATERSETSMRARTMDGTIETNDTIDTINMPLESGVVNAMNSVTELKIRNERSRSRSNSPHRH